MPPIRLANPRISDRLLTSSKGCKHANPKKASSGSQFYIVQGKIYSDAELNIFEQRLGKKFTKEERKVYTTIGGTPHLDTQYTVFGEVISGINVVFEISDSKTDSNDRPLEDIYIISTKVYKKRSKK